MFVLTGETDEFDERFYSEMVLVSVNRYHFDQVLTMSYGLKTDASGVLGEAITVSDG